MTWEDIWQIIGIWLLSTVKFVFGAVPLALALGFSFWKTILVTCSGGFVGSTIFINLGEFLAKRVIARRERRIALGQVHPKKFTRTNRFIVKLKRNFGLPGIAVMTPFVLSIPLGCYVAARYYQHKPKLVLILWMYAAIVFWSVGISCYKLFLSGK